MRKTGFSFLAAVLILTAASVVCHADATQDLFKAIDNKDLNAAQAALNAGANVNALAENLLNIANISPLSYAVDYDATDIVKLLIDRGADVNFTAPLDKSTPLTVAAERGDTEICRMLLEKGAKVDEIDGLMEYSPLMWAAEGSHDDEVALLLAHGAVVDAENKHGVTALQVAGNAASAQLLLDHGAYVNAQDDQGVTALDHTAASSDTARLKLLLLRKAEVNHADKDGWTALFYATGTSTAENAQTLLAHGAKLNAIDGKGKTAFYYAQARANDAVIKVLVKAGANGGKMPPPTAATLTAADRSWLDATCHMQTGDIDVIPQFDKDTVKFLLARIALRDCSLLQGFTASRNYFRQLKPNVALPMPPAGWDAHYLTDDEIKQYQTILDNAPW